MLLALESYLHYMLSQHYRGLKRHLEIPNYNPLPSSPPAKAVSLKQEENPQAGQPVLVLW